MKGKGKDPNIQIACPDKVQKGTSFVGKCFMGTGLVKEVSFFFSFIFISWRLITLQYCSGFCHTLT